MKRLGLLMLGCFLMWGAAPAGAQYYNCIPLVLTDKAYAGVSTAINNNDMVAGYYFINNGDDSVACFWDFNSTGWSKRFDLPSQWGSMEALGINDKNHVVGYGMAWNEVNGSFDAVPFCSVGNLSVSRLKPDPGKTFQYGYANDINESDQIVGRLYRHWPPTPGAQPYGYPCVWTSPDADPTWLAAPDDNVTNEAKSISANGMICGYIANFGAVIWPSMAEKFVTLGSIYSYSNAFKINKQGRAVGDFTRKAGDPTRACYWELPAKQAELFPDLGGRSTTAYGLNHNGQIVGSSDTDKGETHAFIWDEKNGMKDLNQLINNPDRLPGMVLVRATAINDNGVICATGTDSEPKKYEGRAYALVPSSVPPPPPPAARSLPARLLEVLLGK